MTVSQNLWPLDQGDDKIYENMGDTLKEGNNSRSTLVAEPVQVFSCDSHEHGCHLEGDGLKLIGKVWVTRLWTEALRA